jgi:hypothetical protein
MRIVLLGMKLQAAVLTEAVKFLSILLLDNSIVLS